ncbi:serine/threonine protein kinase [Legionella sp. W05-934-2]|uniref:serine/threonine protein kinase n=1 Tax=Legionella sp. W05-934-2 TaxID=1198649 RepID=UPI0034631880
MNTHDFANLKTDTMIDALESLGYRSDLRVLALNSYENRVYQMGIEEAEPIIIKFYRPNRWSNEQINEEHDFSLSLHAMEVPVIPPIVIDNKSLFEYEGYRFSLYRRQGGHAPELDDLNCLYNLGQHLGRLHAIGKTKPFEFRPEISLKSYAIDSRNFILNSNMLPLALEKAYESITENLIEKVKQQLQAIDYKRIRLHGDCHGGNILMRPDSLYIVDFDDARTGPAIQDLWMLISGDLDQKRKQLNRILQGYKQFCDFDMRELHLIEPLRTLRIIHYAGWLAKRWEDPAFPMAFPWFNSENYWSEHIITLKEQFSELDEPVIDLSNF